MKYILTENQFQSLIENIGDKDSSIRYDKFIEELFETKFEVYFQVHKIVELDDKRMGEFGDEPLGKHLKRELSPKAADLYIRPSFKGEVDKKNPLIELQVIFSTIDLGLDDYSVHIWNLVEISGRIRSIAEKYGFSLVVRIVSTDKDFLDVLSSASKSQLQNSYVVTENGIKFGNEEILKYLK